MKRFIAIVIFTTGLSAAYYFKVSSPVAQPTVVESRLYLPATHSMAVEPLKEDVRTERPADYDSEMQERAVKVSKEFFDAMSFPQEEHASYECHYCKKENKIFILISRFILSRSRGRGTLRTEDLYDAISNEHYGSFIYQTFAGYRPPVVGWQLFDKNGTLESEWAEAIKPFMED